MKTSNKYVLRLLAPFSVESCSIADEIRLQLKIIAKQRHNLKVCMIIRKLFNNWMLMFFLCCLTQMISCWKTQVFYKIWPHCQIAMTTVVPVLVQPWQCTWSQYQEYQTQLTVNYIIIKCQHIQLQFTNNTIWLFHGRLLMKNCLMQGIR